LKYIFRKKKAAIKSVLLNQNLIAGIGNIYADEILFKSGVRPDRSAHEIKSAEIDKIYQAARKTLKLAIKYRGTTFNDYVDADGNQGRFLKLLKVYQREGKKCLVCKSGMIEKIRVGNRGTRYCAKCQK
jgi:formamidopyrimidine-DNA glycosylase